MFMRFVQLSIKPDAAEAFERFYEHRVAPALLAVDGCEFARLIRGIESETEFISFTLWETAEKAFIYEDSGQYASLIAENAPFEAESTEWKIQLSSDNTLEYLPVKEEPVVKAMPVAAGTAEDELGEKIEDHTYIRILNATVIPASFDDLSALYKDELVPELLNVPGCKAAYLIGMKGKSEGLSITIWENEDAAHAYEASGKFSELMSRAMPYLSEMYQWKMTLDPAKQKSTLIEDDVSVRGYQVVSGESVSSS